jgi:hypothetical protein
VSPCLTSLPSLLPSCSSLQAGGATYSVSTLLHSGIVEERLREADDFPRGGKVLFGEVIIRNDTADIAWVATAPQTLVLGLNNQIGAEGPGAVGRVFGNADPMGYLRLIEFGDQGLVVSEAGFINATWRCPLVTGLNRDCQLAGPRTSQRELDRLLAFADRGNAYKEFEELEFGGRVIDRNHLLPTQINKYGQVVFIHPLGQSPNAIFLATPLFLGRLEEPTLICGTSNNGGLGLLLVAASLGGIAGWLALEAQNSKFRPANR